MYNYYIYCQALLRFLVFYPKKPFFQDNRMRQFVFLGLQVGTYCATCWKMIPPRISLSPGGVLESILAS